MHDPRDVPSFEPFSVADVLLHLVPWHDVNIKPNLSVILLFRFRGSSNPILKSNYSNEADQNQNKSFSQKSVGAGKRQTRSFTELVLRRITAPLKLVLRKSFKVSLADTLLRAPDAFYTRFAVEVLKEPGPCTPSRFAVASTPTPLTLLASENIKRAWSARSLTFAVENLICYRGRLSTLLFQKKNIQASDAVAALATSPVTCALAAELLISVFGFSS